MLTIIIIMIIRIITKMLIITLIVILIIIIIIRIIMIFSYVILRPENIISMLNECGNVTIVNIKNYNVGCKVI